VNNWKINTLKGRLENKTNKVLHAFETLARLSAAGDEIQDEDISKIKNTLITKVEAACQALSDGRDEIAFKLESN
jgi:hypothetical protein